jgi:protein transport protein SEC24
MRAISRNHLTRLVSPSKVCLSFLCCRITKMRVALGIRASIDPSQVPSPIDTMEADRQQWENQEYESMVAHRPPLSTTNFITRDKGVASPKFVRLSAWSLPSSASLAEECGIPLTAVFQPLAELDPRENGVPLIQCSEQGPMRCEWCRGYVNPGVTWLAGGQKWKCNLCRKETNGASWFYLSSGTSKRTLDYLVSLEYSSPFIFSHDAGNDQLKGTVDFSLPRTCRTYWAPHPPPRISNPYYSSLTTPSPEYGREPQVMDFVVALDVSRDAVISGFLQSTCEALLKALCGHNTSDEFAGPPDKNTAGHQSRPWPRGSRVAIITFDRNIHFHHLGVRLPQRLFSLSIVSFVFLPLSHAFSYSPTEFFTRLLPLLLLS